MELPFVGRFQFVFAFLCFWALEVLLSEVSGAKILGGIHPAELEG
jgi:hypothetical protein